MPFNTIWDPGTAGTFGTRADNTGACCAGSGAGVFSNVLGGPLAVGTPAGTNLVDADQSTIINGNNNFIFAAAPPLGPEIYNLIGNGLNHRLTGFNSSIINGEENGIAPTPGVPPVDTHFATVVNGHSNVISGDFSFIGGGGGTPATGNTVEATYGFIGNGSSNHIYIGSDNGFIGGGASNEIATAGSGFASPLSFIGGGEGNAIRTNTAPGAHNVIAGGFFNEICDNSARTMIGGGDHNHAQGSFTFIGGGNQNFALGDGNTVAGGIGNNIRVNSSASFIGGGGSNAVCGQHDTIAGGNGNGILHGANSSVIGGGFVNFIGNPTAIPASNPSNFSFIGGGAFNCVDTNSLTNSEYNAITGGCCNTIQPGSTFGYIGTGECNIVSGLGNQVVGGTHNNVNGFYSFIGGGNQNTINVASAGGPIGTNGIMMGDHNEITGESIFSGIAAGGNNTINNGYASFIGGGDSSCIQSTPGGANICRSFIGGGNFNCIFDSLATIGGGEHNVINAGAPNSFIGGGKNNTVSGACSAILGGNGNNDAGLANVHIVGSGITALSPNTVHVNGLWANGLPTYAGGPPIAPAGTVFILAPGTPAPAWAQGQLWIA